jgi:dipeptidyl aminopeptidase/acylaminoacyl peptidase
MAFEQYTARLRDAEIWRERLGRDQRALWQMSPASRLHAIRTPLLMMQGRLDPVVPVRQARRFARALRKAGKEHTLIERGDCDHEMTIESCRVAFFAALQDFLGASLAP